MWSHHYFDHDVNQAFVDPVNRDVQMHFTSHFFELFMKGYKGTLYLHTYMYTYIHTRNALFNLTLMIMHDDMVNGFANYF